MRSQYEEWVEKFGEDNARYLVEVMGGWIGNYTRAAYIDTGLVDKEEYVRTAEEVARDVERSLPGWMHKPDLDVSRIVRNAVLQTWTLCRAVRA